MLNTSARLSSLPPRLKPLGSYLSDAGLLTLDQVQVILADQQSTGMRFGDIATTRGWVKEQTVEWIMRKVVVPERRSLVQAPAKAATTVKQEATSKQPYAYSGAPISKPLPSVKSADSDVVNWVG
jgi:hypothetical protein